MNIRPLVPRDHPCHYLPGIDARTIHFIVDDPTPELIDLILEGGYRHFGSYFFGPRCPDCVRCIPIRIPISRFVPNRAQRRVLRTHQEFRVEIGCAEPSPESYRLYSAHKERFPQSFEDTFESYTRSFYADQRQRRTLSVYMSDRLVSRMHLDVTGRSVSAVYCYYDDSLPGTSLGTFSILRTIEYARETGAENLYLGYYIRDNPSMRYKLRFYPSQIMISGERDSDEPPEWIDARGGAGELLANEELNRESLG